MLDHGTKGTAAVSFALEPHTIAVVLAGSHAHGTAREGSDVDVRGVCIAPLQVRLSLFERFEQVEGAVDPQLAAAIEPGLRAHPTASACLGTKLEGVVFDLAKFLGLCATANPNALEILFADERDWLLARPAWRRLYADRHRFLTRRVEQTYLGYAMAQLAKIETHRGWLLHPPAGKPTRAEFGLPDGPTLGADDRNRIEAGIAERLRRWGIDDLEMPKSTRIALAEHMHEFWRDTLACDDASLAERTREVATAALGLPAPIVAALAAEKRYRAACKHWDAYQAWQSQRNPARAELERLHGYDTKHAMHLVRLMHTGVEILEHGELRVRRPDAEELAAIRGGALPFEALRVRTDALRERMQAAARGTTLPADLDRAWLDALALELMC